ncbi:MAG: hypothetical protein ABR608_14260 [Pseudonocardiaceae bacterium]
MIEESRENLSEPADAATGTSAKLGEAMEAVKATSPELAEAINAAGITPDELADARERSAPGEQPGPGAGEG